MRPTLGLQMFRPTPRMMAPVHPKSGIMAKLKKVPPELFPLAVVVGFALCAATFSSTRKFFVDKNLRLSRQGHKGDDPHAEEHH